MSCAISLRFQERDFLNSAITAPDGTIQYTITTATKGWTSTRTLTEVSGTRAGLVATINWVSKTFSIEGDERPWADLKGTPEARSFWSDIKCRVWTWAGSRYTVRYAPDDDDDGKMRYIVQGQGTRKDGAGLASETSEASSLNLARFSPTMQHLFRSTENAAVTFLPETGETERISSGY
ncbi:hypothetical protein FB45DRAFT_1055924 [Roridomyces roridus]|uniref:Uncharacterized protein n=1 Tax=Roridomyces roridus TaxID=1738132 RepID=A0AAD7C1M3_9AGAR|nr:hypothetical protein FB45DRAFT_1055924 [Roridomyces roridus]